MTRCKPLLGTYVEITAKANLQKGIKEKNLSAIIEKAFDGMNHIEKVMSFHRPDSELSEINAISHLKPIRINPLLRQVLKIAQEIYVWSDGLFNCGIGQHLLHPKSPCILYGGIQDIQFNKEQAVYSSKPICIDLGGIAKGFAVDHAVNTLQDFGIESGCVNAGGDLKVFGDFTKPIYIRCPQSPKALIEMGVLQNGAIATTGCYPYSSHYPSCGQLINPLSGERALSIGSFSVIACDCTYADALTKVFTLSKNRNHPCFKRFQAVPIWIN
ncbi:MAG: FAD:protein FMN transferase [Polynucleobacter sp.]|jgi:thiamine biosynthesis lipoprotein|nr:FAD:protein FMN transferase [Polynucleobacter sp.]